MILSFLWVRESLHFISRKLKTDHFELLNYKGGEKWKKLLQSKKEPTNFFLFLLVTLLSETKLSGCSTAVEHMPHDRVFVGSYQTGYRAFFSFYGFKNVFLTKKWMPCYTVTGKAGSNFGLHFFVKRLVEDLNPGPSDHEPTMLNTRPLSHLNSIWRYSVNDFSSQLLLLWSQDQHRKPYL